MSYIAWANSASMLRIILPDCFRMVRIQAPDRATRAQLTPVKYGSRACLLDSLKID